jgi:NTP pyrophosphatase (non-canonical NTP hydrolase)
VSFVDNQGVLSAVTSSDHPTPEPSAPPASRPEITLAEFQQLIRRMYMEKDIARGIDGTFMWLMEEVGELAAALRNGTLEERTAEFADVLAWLATIANVAGVDLTQAVMQKYGTGCPGCGRLVCSCPDAGKP